MDRHSSPPETRSRWNRTSKLMGLTPERFSQMLEAQGNACAMCRTAFEEDQRICIDHDHACCPPTLPSRCCGKCVRGLLCLTCNIALGYIEAYSELATGYLRQHYAGQSPQPAGHSGLAVLRGEEADLVVDLQQESHQVSGVLPRPGTARHGETGDAVEGGPLTET